MYFCAMYLCAMYVSAIYFCPTYFCAMYSFNLFLCNVFLCKVFCAIYFCALYFFAIYFCTKCNVQYFISGSVFLCNLSMWCISLQCMSAHYISLQCIDGNTADLLSGGNGLALEWTICEDIEYYRAGDDTRFDTLSDDGMPCEMDNQASPWDSISRGAAEDSEYYRTR